MEVNTLLHAIDLLLWALIAISVAYPLVFALASLLPGCKKQASATDAVSERFLVLFPAYAEDGVIMDSVQAFLRQDYPTSHFQVVVISDHMQSETNCRLSQLPITLLTPIFEKSSKARALQYAITQTATPSPATPAFSHVVILDADNHVQPTFLSQLSSLCRRGYQAIQCHRTAKNSDSDIAVLDGVSEEINNSIFRRGHNRLGLSSALIGSGMCFSYDWFCQNVSKLDSAVEDRELEALLLWQGIHIHYAEDILVEDEKVSSHDNFQRQRMRWMNGQVQSLLRMMPRLPKAIVRGNINYFDKTLQQALIPRSILLLVLPVIAILMTFAAFSWSVKWWALVLALCIALLVAIPPRMRTHAIFSRVTLLPRLVWRMLCNIVKIDKKNTDFLHTTHGSGQAPSHAHEQGKPENTNEG